MMLKRGADIHDGYMPEEFVYLSDVDPSIEQNVRYATADNFTGSIVSSYDDNVVILTRVVAEALAKVQRKLNIYGLGLKIFDGYRPHTAVLFFKQWASSSVDENINIKQKYYPNIDKAELFMSGYISSASKHSRGGAVDLTIVNLSNTAEQQGKNAELDMGTEFDFLDQKSHVLNTEISLEAMQNRCLLRSFMEEAGFQGYRKEWWHFDFMQPTYENTFFDFPVKSGYKTLDKKGAI